MNSGYRRKKVFGIENWRSESSKLHLAAGQATNKGQLFYYTKAKDHRHSPGRFRDPGAGNC
jgi:hypothetical protein